MGARLALAGPTVGEPGIAVGGVTADTDLRIVCLVRQFCRGSLSFGALNADTAPQTRPACPTHPELSGTATTVPAYVDVYGPLAGHKRPR